MRSKLDGVGVLLLNGFFPLTGSRASESDIDCHIIGVITVVAVLLSVTPWSAIGIFGTRSAWIPRCGIAASQPAILARAKAGHECREGRHGFWLLLAEMSGEPLVADIMLKGRQGFGVQIVDNLVLFS